uniref:Putative vesicle-associated membrane protein 726 n=1 Tax=Rhizophora mucronata TaxID=61149 RepID=A0A2P2LS09_RHIMU
MANGQHNDENQGNQDTQHYQLYFHVLQPHLPPHLGALLPKILCLQQHNNGQAALARSKVPTKDKYRIWRRPMDKRKHTKLPEKTSRYLDEWKECGNRSFRFSL